MHQAEYSTSQITKLKPSQWKKGTNKSLALLWSDVFGGNLLGKMLIYPLHCRLLPPPFKMWLFSDAQGNFDPLRLLWSEAPFNRSSAQEFKLILSLPTTGSPQRFGVKVKALPRCQSCWQPAPLKAPPNAADQRDSLLMGSAPTVTGAGNDSNWDQHFFILVCGRGRKTDFKLCNAVFLHFGSYYAVRLLHLKIFLGGFWHCETVTRTPVFSDCITLC